MLRVGWSGDGIPVGARYSAPVQTDPGAHPASYTMSTGMEMYLHFSTRFHVVNRDKFVFTFTFSQFLCLRTKYYYVNDNNQHVYFRVKNVITNLIEITNKMRPCSRIYYSSVS